MVVRESLAEVAFVQGLVATSLAVFRKGLIIGFLIACEKALAWDRYPVDLVRLTHARSVFAIEPLVKVKVVLEQAVLVAIAPDLGLGVAHRAGRYATTCATMASAKWSWVLWASARRAFSVSHRSTI